MAIDWMKHPLNAREQQNVAKMMMKNGMAGYGAFWALNELLMNEEAHKVEPDYNVLGYRLHCDAGLVKSVATEFGLYVFTEDGEYMHSELVDGQASHIDESMEKRSAAGKKAAEARWQGKNDAEPKQADANRMPIVYESHANAMRLDARLDKTKTKTNKDLKTSSPKRKKRVFGPESEELKISTKLWDAIKANNHEAKKPDLQKWADEVRKMHELDHRPFDKISRMVDWSQADGFWKTNILSPEKLRKHYDQMAAKANEEAAQAKHPVQPRYGKPQRQEAIPEWMAKDYKAPKQEATEADKAELAAQLAELDKLRQEHDA